MQREHSHCITNTTNSGKAARQGSRKQISSTLTADSNSDDRQIRNGSQTRTYVNGSNILPSKFDKMSFRPLPPLVLTNLVKRNDTPMSFKPIKSSDCRSQSTLPLKGRHECVMPTAHDSSDHATPHATRLETTFQCETEFTCSETTDELLLGKNRRKNKELPAQLRRCHSISQLYVSTSDSASTRSSKLSRCPSRSLDTAPNSCITPRINSQCTADENSADLTVYGQGNDGIYSASNRTQRPVSKTPRQRSSSVSSCSRVHLQAAKQSQISSPSTLGTDNHPTDTDVSLVEGRQRHSFAKENSLKAIDKDGTAKALNDTKPASLDHHYAETTYQHVSGCNNSLEPNATVTQLHKAKPMEKSSSNHGILGGKSSDEVPELVKSSVGVDYNSSPCATRHNSTVV